MTISLEQAFNQLEELTKDGRTATENELPLLVNKKRGRIEWHLLKLKSTVILAMAGIHMRQWWLFLWIPAFAGMTIKLFCGNNLPN